MKGCGTFIDISSLPAQDRRELRNFQRFLRLWPDHKLRMLNSPRFQKYLGLMPDQAFRMGKWERLANPTSDRLGRDAGRESLMGTYSASKIRRARKEKTCASCKELIQVSSRYLDYKPGLHSSVPVHVRCAIAAGNAFRCAAIESERAIKSAE